MEQIEEQAITAHDRCDQCGAQAYFLSVFEAGELYFCRHHFLKNEEVIRELAYHVVDQSGTLIGDM